MSITHKSWPRETKIEEDTLYNMLRSSRRRITINFLSQSDDSVITVKEIADGVSETEGTKSQTCYVSLIQTHLPKLNDAGLIEYNECKKRVKTSSEINSLSVIVDSIRDVTQ